MGKKHVGKHGDDAACLKTMSAARSLPPAVADAAA